MSDHTQHTNDTPNDNEDFDTAALGGEGEQRSMIARRLRLLGALLQANLHRELPTRYAPNRGEVREAVRAVEDRATRSLTPEELATTLAALDKMTEALGGLDALPAHPRGRGGRRGFGPGFRGFGPGMGGRRGLDHDGLAHHGHGGYRGHDAPQAPRDHGAR